MSSQGGNESTSLWYTGLYEVSVFRFGVFGLVRMDNTLASTLLLEERSKMYFSPNTKGSFCSSYLPMRPQMSVYPSKVELSLG